MDKFEYKVRADEIKELISQERYAEAAEIADTIDWRRVKSVMMLCTISDLYKINRRYEDARDILLLAYDRRPGGRTICYSLCELSIKMEEIAQAKEYLDEFISIAPKDPGRYVLQYKLLVALDVSIEERIEVLQKLKEQDPRERWQYELAYLYHKIGLESHCVEECDELILWFGEGKYVIKAMELKMLHQPLTPEQQAQYEEYKRNLERPAQKAYEEQSYPTQSEEMPIQVKTMDVSQYNTINLQQELAADLEKVLQPDYQSGRVKQNVNISPEVLEESRYDADTESLDNPEIGEVSTEDLEAEDLRYETVQVDDAVDTSGETEVFFGETGELTGVNPELAEDLADAEVEELQEEPVFVETQETEAQDDEIREMLQEELILGDAQEPEEAVTEESEDTTRDKVMEELKNQSTGVIAAITAEPPRFLAEVLSQEADGQLSLVVPEKEDVEKQITGQLNIDDILAEWERIKKENQEKRQEEVRQHVLQQTGSMFTDFEASVRDGLLEQLESGELTMDHLEDAIQEMSDEESSEVAEELQEEAEGFYEDSVQDAEDTIDEIQEFAEETAEMVEDFAQEGEDAIAEDAQEITEAAEEFIQEAEEVEEATTEVVEEVAEEAEAIEEAVEEAPSKPEVVRDQAKLRSLTREERDLFAPFIQSKSSKEQLIRALDNVSMASFTGNLIITGDEGIDILTLAKNIVAEVKSSDSNFNGKLAKISGKALNDRDVAETLNRLAGGALIIHGASGMKAETVKTLHKELQQENLGIIVILEDTKKAMDKLLAANPILKESFTARMDVEALSNDLLVSYGKKYALEQEYFIDDLGVLALHTKIENRQTSDHAVTTLEVKEIVDEAIEHVNRKTIGHFFDILLAKRYDKEDMIVLTEKDFI